LAVYKNAKVDTLLESLRKEKDSAKMQSGLKTVSGLITDDEPAVFLFSIDNLYVSSKNLEGVAGGFLENPADRFAQLPLWYVNNTIKLESSL